MFLLFTIFVTQIYTSDIYAATHTHSYSAATCTSPAKCSCGATSGSASGHSYYQSYEAAHPHRVYNKCSRCGTYSYTGSTTTMSTCCSCAGHNYTGATCTVAGKCSRCGATGSTAAHSYYQSNEAAHPHKVYNKCRNCGTYTYTGSTTTVSTCCSCVGHNFTGATCSVAGTCSRCGATGSTTPHNWESGTHFEAAHPHRIYKNCTACSAYTYTGSTTTMSTCCTCVGHIYTGATCTVAGKCSRCGATGSTTAHSTNIGFEVSHPHREYYKCRDCSYYSYTGTNRVSYDQCCSCVGHNYTGATCTVAGKCSRCGATGSTTAHSTYIGYEVAHPHREYYRCRNCDYYSYIGTNRESWEEAVHFEAAHPHKEYVKCNVVTGCIGFTYTGTNKESYLGCTTCHSVHSYTDKTTSAIHTVSGHEITLTCSCGASISGGYEKVLGCCECGNHVWDAGSHLEDAHIEGYGHRYYYKCTKSGCIATKYTGTYKQEWETDKHFEAAHPHREYYRCSVVTNCEGFKYTGTYTNLWDSELHYQGKHESGKGHQQYKLCEYTDATGKKCNQAELVGTYVPDLIYGCTICTPVGHTHNWKYEYEASHPHKQYKVCVETHDGIRVWAYTGETQLVASCTQCPVPDLIITNISFSPATPKVGDEVTFTATIKNIGRGPSPNNTIHGVQFLVDGIQVGQSTSYTTAISVGGTANISGTWSSATEGTHTILAKVDDLYDRIYELNEYNNGATSSITVEKVTVVDPGTGTGGDQGTGNPPPVTTVKLIIGGKVISSARMYNGEPVADFSDLAFTLGDNVMGVQDLRDTITISYKRPDGGYGEVTYNQSDLIHISDHEHWFPIIRMANDMQYGGQVHTFSNSDGSQGIYIDLYSLVQYASLEAILDAIQVGLDLVGLIPVVGEPADGTNAIIYLARGDEVNAALSAASLASIVGWVSTGGKLVNKTIKCVTKYGDDVFEGVVKLTNATEYFSKVSTKTKVIGSYPPSYTASQVLRDELKTAGVATPPYLNAAHHIIPWDDQEP